MNKRKLLNTALILTCFALVASCQERTSSTKSRSLSSNLNNSNSSNNSGGSWTSGDDQTSDDRDSDSVTGVPPYQVSNDEIIFKPAGSNNVAWSTKSHLSSTRNQDMFLTNSRLKIRIKPRHASRFAQVTGYAPTYEPINNLGQPVGTQRTPRLCNFNPIQYSSLSIRAEVKSQSGGTGSYVDFVNVPVGSWSEAKRFPHLPYATSNPMDIQFKNVTWQCNQSSCSGEYSYRVFDYECISFEMEVVTDTTDDF